MIKGPGSFRMRRTVVSHGLRAKNPPPTYRFVSLRLAWESWLLHGALGLSCQALIPQRLEALSLKNLKRKCVYQWSKRSGRGSFERFERFNDVAAVTTQDTYLETGILGSLQGKDKFLDSGVHVGTLDWRNNR